MALNRQENGNTTNTNVTNASKSEDIMQFSLDLTPDQLIKSLVTISDVISKGSRLSAEGNHKAASKYFNTAIKGLIALNNMITNLIKNNKLKFSSLQLVFDQFFKTLFNTNFSAQGSAVIYKIIKDSLADPKNHAFPLLESFSIKNLFKSAVEDYIKEGHHKKNVERAKEFLKYTESEASLAETYINMLDIINSNHAKLKETMIRYLAWQYDLAGELEESTGAAIGGAIGGAVIGVLAVAAVIAIAVITEGKDTDMITTTMDVASSAMDIVATSMMTNDILSDLENSIKEDEETLNEQVRKKLRVLIEQQGMVEVLVGSSTTVWMKKDDVKDIFGKLKSLAITVANLISKKDLNKDPDKLDMIRKAIAAARNRHELRSAVARLEKSCADFIGTNPIEVLLKTIINKINRFEEPRSEDCSQMISKVFKLDLKKTQERIEALTKEFRSWKFNTKTITGTGLYEETASLGLDPISSSLNASLVAIQKVILLEVTDDTFNGINKTLEELEPEINKLRAMYAEQKNEEAARQQLFGEAIEKTGATQKLAQRTLALIEKLFADYGTVLTKDHKKIHKVIDKARHLADSLLDEDRLVVKMYKDDGIDPSYEQIKEEFARIQQLYKLIASKVEKRNAKVATPKEGSTSTVSSQNSASFFPVKKDESDSTKNAAAQGSSKPKKKPVTPRAQMS